MVKFKVIASLFSLSLFVFVSTSVESQQITSEQVDLMVTQLSNWGRWGSDDQLGTLNLITAEKRLEAARLVEHGVSVSMAQDLITESAVDNSNPFEHSMEVRPTTSNPWDWYIPTLIRFVTITTGGSITTTGQSLMSLMQVVMVGLS